MFDINYWASLHIIHMWYIYYCTGDIADTLAVQVTFLSITDIAVTLVIQKQLHSSCTGIIAVNLEEVMLPALLYRKYYCQCK